MVLSMQVQWIELTINGAKHPACLAFTGSRLSVPVNVSAEVDVEAVVVVIAVAAA